jgi:hypothetical protein
VNEKKKFSAAGVIAYSVKDDELNEDYILPSIFNKTSFLLWPMQSPILQRGRG